MTPNKTPIGLVAMFAILAGHPAAQDRIDIRPGSASSSPSTFVHFLGDAWFSADDGQNGRELWRTDGTAAGTRLALDLESGSGSSFPLPVAVLGDRLLFIARTAATGQELWSTDGTPSGTRVIELSPGTASTLIRFDQRAQVGSRMFFYLGPGAANLEPWVTDGTVAGTRLLRDIQPGSRSSVNPSTSARPLVVGNRVWFSADNGTNGLEPWVTDLTSAGTRLVADVIPGADPSFPRDFLEFQGRVWFGVYNNFNSSARGLVSSDGTTAGTRVRVPLSGRFGPTSRIGNRLVFANFRADVGTELFSSDGTPAGTSLVRDIRSGPSSSIPLDFTAVEGRIYFRALSAPLGFELWATDGTTAGTNLVRELNPGTASATPDSLTPIGDNRDIAFRAITPAGREPCFSDGTSGRTRVIADIRPNGNSEPVGFFTINDRLLFSADDGQSGRELWSVDLRDLGVSTVVRIGDGCGTPEPALTTSGPSIIDNTTFGFDLADAPASAAGSILFGTDRARVPVGGSCELLVGGALLALPITTTATGVASYPLPLPNNTALLGEDPKAQAAVLQAGGPALGAANLSNGIEIIVGR